MKEFIKSKLRKQLIESTNDYSMWKRKYVTLRGVKEGNVDNEVFGSFGKGLYTVPLNNKAMAKQYGELRFVVNATPKNPKIVDSLNNAEIWRQSLIKKFCDSHGKSYDANFFQDNTTIEAEMLNLGYDGLIIKGREMVNYTPENIVYFKNEDQLMRYFETLT